MKDLKLNNYGVQEMNAVEMMEVDGGSVVGTILGIATAVIIVARVVLALTSNDAADGLKIKGGPTIGG